MNGGKGETFESIQTHSRTKILLESKRLCTILGECREGESKAKLERSSKGPRFLLLEKERERTVLGGGS